MDKIWGNYQELEHKECKKVMKVEMEKEMDT